VNPENTLEIRMVAHGLDAEQAKNIWQPFLDWVADSSHNCSLKGRVTIGSIPARHWWDVQCGKSIGLEIAFPNPNGSLLTGLLDSALEHVIPQPVLDFDNRPGAGPNNAWWKGDGGQVAWFIWGFESLWMPASLLENDAQQRLADALFAASRHAWFELHFNKGLAGAPPEALERSKDTATNPAVLNAFALAIAGNAQGPAYPGIPGHEPSVDDGRKARTRIMNAWISSARLCRTRERT